MKRLLAYLFLVLSLGLMFNVNAEEKPKSWIGIEFKAVTEEFIKNNKLNTNTPKNIIVVGVVKTSAADEAKILPGDIIISINNNVIKKTQDLINFLKTTQPSDIITAKIYRNGSVKTKKIKLKKYPDPGFKAEWVAGSKKLKDAVKPFYGLENTLWSHSGDDIFYPKYFSKDLVNKYKGKAVVVCVQKNTSNNILKLNDEIIATDGKPLGSFVKFTNKSVKIKIKRNNRIINKTITPTVVEIMKIRHDCIPEYAAFDCTVDYLDSWKLPQKSNSRGDALRKTLACIKDYSIVPFSSFLGKKEDNLKMKVLSLYIGYLQYDAPEKDLDEINKILAIAKKELKEFEKFQKIYPDHEMQKPYNQLITAITRATQWAAGSYSEDFKSTKDTTIKTDKDTVKSTKLALEKIIKNKKINSPEALKFLTSKSYYFKRANELEYLIKKYVEAKNAINWEKDNLDEYFDDIYYDLAVSYQRQQQYETSENVLNEGLEIAENNYENLYFKNAYTELINVKFYLTMMYKPESFFGGDTKKFRKNLKMHLSNLEDLSPTDKEKMIKIDKGYYVDLFIPLYLLNIMSPEKTIKATYYPLKQLDYIKSNINMKYNFNLYYVAALTTLLQASIIDDDLKNFNFANNELTILFSESVGNPKKLNAIKTGGPMILSSYESSGFYLKSDNFIKFMENTFTIDKQIKNDHSIREAYILYSHYKAQSALRNNDIEKAKKIYETGVEISKPNLKNVAHGSVNYSLYEVMVVLKYVPELYEIYFNEKNYKKLNKINRVYINNDISNLSKRDLKYINLLDVNSYKILKIYLKYFEEKKIIRSLIWLKAT